MPPNRYRQRRGPRPQRKRTGARPGAVLTETAPVRPAGPVELPNPVVVKDFAEILGVSIAEIINVLIRNGIFATVNQSIDFDTASLVAGELGFETTERGATERAAAAEAAEHEIVAPGAASETNGRTPLWVDDDPSKLVARAPIVTVMGHVDHGKTSLLDAIRETKVASGESGGITQHIGASEVDHNGKRIVFLDTPGHEAFSAMRARGAQVTDIAIIVVAADDGVMPQTKEAIDHVRAARVPMIVAINKIDKPDAQPDRVKQELADNGVLIEEYGGDIIAVAVSAKQRTGIDDLMEMVLLVADLQDLKANPDRDAIGTIVESKVDKGRGNVATVLVQTGTLKVGDVVSVGRTHGRVRALNNAAGKRVKTAEPATAVEIIGLQGLAGGGRHPARGRGREDRTRRGRDGRDRRRRRRGPDGQHARGGQRPDQGQRGRRAAGRAEDRRPGLARRDPARARAAEHGRGSGQHPARGRRRHQRERHQPRLGVGRGRHRLQHEARRRRAALGRGDRGRRADLRRHLQADRRPRPGPLRPPRRRSSSSRSRATPRCGW